VADDIVSRLRELLDYKDGGWPSDSLAWLLADAADEIERLRSLITEFILACSEETPEDIDIWGDVPVRQLNAFDALREEARRA
jgi:hypothetical protein